MYARMRSVCMRRGKWEIMNWVLGVTLLVGLTACSSIDEDMSDCGVEYEMEYELQLTTDIETALQTQLTSEKELQVADALRNYLDNIFSGVAHDIDLSFYGTGTDATLLHQENHQMNDSNKTYTIFLPENEYRNIALANINDNQGITKEGTNQSSTFTLQQEQSDIVPSQTAAIYTGCVDMDVKEGDQQKYHVDLYMVNSVTALVIDNALGVEVKDIQVYATGFATGFNVNDSTYTFVDNPPLVQAQSVDTGLDDMLCFCTVNFPSRDKAEGDEPLWQYVVYVTLADGSVTKSVLEMKEPLGAGDLKVVTAHLQPDGSLQPDSALVGVSITLEWKQGGTYEPEM